MDRSQVRGGCVTSSSNGEPYMHPDGVSPHFGVCYPSVVVWPSIPAEVHPMSSSLERRLFFLLIATLVWSSAMLFEANGISSPDFRAPSGCYFTGKPIVDAELAQTPACFRSIVTQGADEGHDHNVALVRANTYMDFLFIVLYWAIFVAFAQIENGWSGKLASVLITLSALADVWENVRILSGLRALSSATAVDFTVPRGVSVIKWDPLA